MNYEIGSAATYREMIVLYPVPLNEIIFSEPNVVARANKLYPYCGLEF